MLPKPPKTTLEKLYRSGLSMMQIAQKLGFSHNKIAYWMNKYNINRRSISTALYRKNNPSGDPFSIKKRLSVKEQFLLGIGLGLYWGEGNKADKYSVRVGTTDSEMIRVFRLFLKTICGVSDNKFKYSLICFKNAGVQSARNYWSKQLNIKPSLLGKITKIPSLGKGNYRKTSQHGVCTIYVFNIKLKKWIMDQLDLLKYNKISSGRFSSVGRARTW